ncbi:hypothetical protein ACI3PL_23115, partial [Lacticaseibacillus paracasei]
LSIRLSSVSGGYFVNNNECWTTGTESVTISNGTPCVVGLTAHGLTTGNAVKFTGTLPAGLTANTTYFIRKEDVGTPADQFHLYSTLAYA